MESFLRLIQLFCFPFIPYIFTILNCQIILDFLQLTKARGKKVRVRLVRNRKRLCFVIVTTFGIVLNRYLFLQLFHIYQVFRHHVLFLACQKRRLTNPRLSYEVPDLPSDRSPTWVFVLSVG